MKCPACGNPKATYKESRHKFWAKPKGLNTPGPRTNFDAECPACNHKWNTNEGIEKEVL